MSEQPKSKKEIRAEKQQKLQTIFQDVVKANLNMLSNGLESAAFEQSIQTVHDGLTEDQVRGMAVSMFTMYLSKEVSDKLATMAFRLKEYSGKLGEQ